jgi:hypothetical protein
MERKIEEICEIFPEVEKELVEDVMMQCGGKTEDAIEILIALREDVEGKRVVVQEDEELSPKVLERIAKDAEIEYQQRLKNSKEFDKDMQKAMIASRKEYIKEKEKEEKEKKKMSKKKGQKEEKKGEEKGREELDLEEVKRKKDEEMEKTENKYPELEYQSVPVNKPQVKVEPVPEPAGKRITFTDRLKNIFKKSSKPAKSEQLDIEIPDIKHN